MLKAVKIRLYPNAEQRENINKLLGCYRKVYNLALDKKKEVYYDSGENYRMKELGNEFHGNWLKDDDLWYLKEHNTKVLKQSLMNMLEAYKNFFVNGSGFPRFKSKHDNKNSARFPREAISVKDDNFNNNKVTLTKDFKNIKYRCSDKDKRYLQKYKKNIRSATLTRTKSGKYFLSVLVDGDMDNNMDEPINDIVGIDLGVKDFVVDSNGNKYNNLKIKRNNHKKIAKLHRQLSKKKDGSNNKEKAKRKLARYYEHLTNKKEEYLHHVANTLLRENQAIAMEDLNIKGMMQNEKLSRSIQELSLYRFKEILKYKAKWYGRDIVEMDRFFASSKLCSNCGWKNNELTLNDRAWKCGECGIWHDRDHNAATNIMMKGKEIIPARRGESAPLDSGNAGVSNEGSVSSTHWMN